MIANAPLDRRARWVVAGVLAATGGAALLAQVTWQRTIALYVGVDLESSITVVAAFLGGLGLGNLAGGPLADRVDRRRALLLLGATSALLAVVTLASVDVLVDGYRAMAPRLDGVAARVGFNAAVLLVPTFLQGLSLPLVARVVASDPDSAGSEIGWFNALNTLGAALGASAGGWVLLGRYGLDGAARLAAVLQLAAAGAYLLLGTAGPAAGRPAGRRAVRGVSAVAVVGGAAWFLGRAVAALPRFGGAWPAAVVTGGLAGAAVVCLARSRPVPAGAPSAVSTTDDGPDEEAPDADLPADGPARSPWPWYVAYGVTGAVALGFEQVAFRLVGGIVRSNAYTFGHVLSLYLGLLAVGGALGARARRRFHDDRRAFLWLQAASGLSAVVGIVLATVVLPEGVLAGATERWAAHNGLASGFLGEGWSGAVVFGLVLPLVLLGLPVLCTGASFPFVQGIVTDRLERVGHRTGGLVFANLVGNVAGTLLTGFVLLDRWGVIGAVRVLCLPLVVLGVLAAWRAPRPRWRPVGAVAVVVVAGLALASLPDGVGVWQRLQDRGSTHFWVAEDRSCVSALLRDGDGPDATSALMINGALQNDHPFDDFHVLIGLVPALAHDRPDETLAIGFGIGSTTYALLASPRTASVTSAELCGGNFELADRLAAEGVPDFEVLRDDPRHHRVVGDGRRLLVVADEDRFDVVVPDTVLPTSAGSGNLYSRDFQELLSSRLADDGIAAGWVPTVRALNAVTATFPYVVTLSVDDYNGSTFYLASRSPIELDRSELLSRFDALPERAFSPGQRASLRRFLATLEPTCVNDGQLATVDDPEDENRDLRPLDEYFLTNPGLLPDRIARTCG